MSYICKDYSAVSKNKNILENHALLETSGKQINSKSSLIDESLLLCPSLRYPHKTLAGFSRWCGQPEGECALLAWLRPWLWCHTDLLVILDKQRGKTAITKKVLQQPSFSLSSSRPVPLIASSAVLMARNLLSLFLGGDHMAAKPWLVSDSYKTSCL